MPRLPKPWLTAFLVAALVIGVSGIAAAAGKSIAVTTYHYDSLRTGWNDSETTLTAAKFPSTFGLLQSVALDDQVDAQPLVVPAETIAGGTHDVVYVVTENNSVYAIDANSGAILVQTNLGPPVPTPLGCSNNGPNVGITSTPVIDLTLGEIFVIAYVNGSSPSYQLHALNLTTLADQVPPVTVAATQTLTNGSAFAFNATYQRQRPGLLKMDGAIYAGFGSFCDFDANQSRGWVLGWNKEKLTPLAHAELNDTQATSPTSFFLSSVWMSGFALAGTNNTVFFSTGNSDCNFYVSPEDCPSQSTYDGVTNIQESVIGLTNNLATRTGVFTPSNVFQMDIDDADLGASGVMLMPTARVGASLASIVSKDGRLWLLNTASLGTALNMQQLANGCWCGTSYFQGSDGINRVVSSAGDALQTWQVQTSPTPQLVSEAVGYVQSTEQDPGFFTSVSSNGRRAGSAIIWAVARPTASAALTLYAFAAAPVNGTLTQLYSAPAGQWPNLGGNADTVPVVANGKVYVASYQALMIFGANGTAVPASAAVPLKAAIALPPGSTRRVSGTLMSINGTLLSVLTRNNQAVQVEASGAIAAERVAVLNVGRPYTVVGNAAAGTGVLLAQAVSRAKRSAVTWPDDR
jgi:outer membrane protein assembly factor BamB